MPLQSITTDEDTPEDILSGKKAEKNDDDFELDLNDNDDSDDDESLDFDNSFEEDEEDEEVEVEETSEELDEGEEENDEEEEFEESELEEDEDEQEKARGKRENDRIRTLVEERKKTQELLARERAERLQIQKQMVEMQKAAVASNLNLLESQVDALKNALIQAQNEGDQSKAVDIQMQLNKAQNDLNALENWEAPEGPSDDEIQRATQQANAKDPYEDGPQALKDWVDDNPWVRNPITAEDEERRAEALAYSQVLERKGISVESPEFFRMIDERLVKLGLAEGQKNEVKSKTSKDKTSSTRRKKKKVSQTVQGASRTPHSKSKRRNSNKVTLSKDQLEIAELYGMSPKEYAKELLKIEKAAKQNKRMVSIFE